MREDHPTVPEETGASSKSRAFSSIQGRLVSLLLFVLVPILVAQAYFSYDRYQSAKRVEVDANLDLARATAKAFDTFVQDVLHQELAIGLAFTSSQTLSEEEKSRILLENRAENQAIWHFFWDNPGGIVAAATGSQFIGMDVSDREFYREIVAGKDWVVSDLILSKTTQQPSFTISRGIRNERGELLGIIVAGILPAKLDRVLAVKRPGDAGVSLLDSKGMNAYRYPAAQYTWEQRNWLKLYPFLEQVAKGKEFVDASHESKIQSGTKRIVAFTPVPSIGWIASCSRSEKETVGPIISATLQETGLILLVALITLLTAFALSRTISSSVKILRNHALSIGRGGKYNPLTISGPTEIRDLAEAFNIMVEGLRFREEALRESALRWAVTLSSIGDAVIASDTSGRVTFLNSVAEQLTGRSLAESAGKPVQEVFRIVNEHTRAVVDDPVSKVLQTGLIVGLANHTVLLRKGGGEIPIDDSGAPIRDEEGRVLGVVLIFRDITERKQAEEALSAAEETARQRLMEIEDLYHNAPVGLCVLDRDLRWVRINERLAEINGIPAEAHIGKRVRDLMPELAETVEPEMRRVLETGQPRLNIEIVSETPAQPGIKRNWLEQWLPLTDADGRATGLSIVVEEITDRKQAEEALRQLNENLERRVAERTSELAHTVEVLQEEISQRVRAENELKLANEQLAQRADQLRRLAGELTEIEQAERKRLSRILHDGLQQHLASAKMQLGGLAEQIENEDLKRAADEIEKVIGEGLSMSRSLNAELCPPILYEGGLSQGLEWLARWMRDKYNLNVELSIEDKSQLPEDVKIFLFESVRELLFNTVKHAQVSRARVRMRQMDGTGLQIIVSDEGAGFDPCQLKSAGENGGGFGLFSIRERIGLIGGSVQIDSAPGKGSRLALMVPHGPVPAVVPLSVDRMCTLVADPQEDTVKDQGTTIRVLLADDHALFRNGLGRLLKNEPCLEVVGQAADGKEAIELAQKLKPDVILMDVSMPRVNGIEATRIIHGQYPDIRIIGLSMYEDHERAQAMRDAGAADYKTKGCAAAELVAAIRACPQARESSLEQKPYRDEKG